MSAKVKDKIYKALMVISGAIVVGFLALILGFVVYKGATKLNWHFLSADFDDEVTYVEVKNTGELGIEIGIEKHDKKEYISVESIEKDSMLIYGTEKEVEKTKTATKAGDVILSIDGKSVEGMSVEEIDAIAQELKSKTLPFEVIPQGAGLPATENILEYKKIKKNIDYSSGFGFGLELKQKEFADGTYIEVVKVNGTSPFKKSYISKIKNTPYPLKKGDLIEKFDKISTTDISISDFEAEYANVAQDKIRIKVVRPGEGVFPLVVNTFAMILLSLLIAMPISVFSAIYLAEYAKKGKLLKVIRFATGCLAGIPSIIYGLFGMLVFVTTLKLGFSLLSGACTLSIMLLPILIGQTEEAILRVPNALREGSYALGRSKLETIFHIVLPNCLSGITVGILLSIGRIVAESAALVLTAGTVARIPEGILQGASTITVRTYIVAKETGDIELACAMGIVTIVMIVLVNLGTKFVEKYDKMKDVA